MNNPGNIEANQIVYKGEVATTNKFANFDTMANGIRAIMVIIYSKILAGQNTISTIISSYAPSSDNNPTSQYIANVAAWTGIDPNQILDSTFYNLDANNGISGMAAAICRQEGNPVNATDLEAGFQAYANDYL